jgi:deoxyribodipyrimidine photo-lyase
MLSKVPAERVIKLNACAVQPAAQFVLYWMIANRRLRYNYALDRAIEWARELKKPLLILEALRVGYEWASDRIHGFVIEGMGDNARAACNRSVLYYPYLEPKAGAGKGLLQALSKQAAIIVTDEFPCFFLPRMVRRAAQQVRIALEAVDSNGILPLRASSVAFPSAYAFRRFIQKNIHPHLTVSPAAEPLVKLQIPTLTSLPIEITNRWPSLSLAELEGHIDLTKFPIDHAVSKVATRGGMRAAEKRLAQFLESKLKRYCEDRNAPDLDGASGFAPYLHFGMLSAHEVFRAITTYEKWDMTQLGKIRNGKRVGFWGMSPSTEAFLDQIVTWRELGYNMCHNCDEYDRYESLPEWAQATLGEHAKDPRKVLYALEQFERAVTYDPLWNAAQTQLVREGRIHNYLRMLWGKKILEWSETPWQALEVMIALNNKYALDGRNPNSYSGIFWVLGRYDRPWGPTRPIFGTIRYMSSDNTARKMSVKGYLERYGAQS